MRPRASIVLLAHNALPYTAACIASIERHTPESHELVLVDNGSTDGTTEWFAARDEGCLIANRRNLGFAVGANQGLGAAEGDVVVLMNNDTLATEGWLTALLAALERDPAIGVAGPVSNYVIDTQRIVDVPYGDAPSEQLERYASARHRDHADQGRELERMSGLCMAIRREVLETVGGFDPAFRTGNWEDDDFSLRVRCAGWRLWVCEDSYLHHFGHRTFDQLPEGYEQLLFENQLRFAVKWGLPAEANPRDFDPVRAFDAARDRVPLRLSRRAA